MSNVSAKYFCGFPDSQISWLFWGIFELWNNQKWGINCFSWYFGNFGGSILDRFLNALSQKGKLNVFVTSEKDKFEYNSVGSMVQ